jgi:hypothetical protein
MAMSHEDEIFLEDVKERVIGINKSFNSSYRIEGNFSKNIIVKAFKLGLPLNYIKEYNENYINYDMCKIAVIKFGNYIFSVPKHLLDDTLIQMCFESVDLPNLYLITKKFPEYLTKDILMKYIEKNPEDIESIPENLLDLDLVKLALQHGLPFWKVPEQYENELELYDLAILNNDFNHLNPNIIYEYYDEDFIKKFNKIKYDNLLREILNRTVAYDIFLELIDEHNFSDNQRNFLMKTLNKVYKKS